MPPRSLPSVLDREAWTTPATLDEIAGAVSTVVSLIEPDAAPERTGILSRFIAEQGYSAAEMKLIERKGPLANHYGKHVRIDVLHSIVDEHRKVRAMLDRMVTGEEVATLCTEHPELSPDDFAPGTFDRFNNRLYRYAPNVARSDFARRVRGQKPVNEDDAPRRLSGGEGPGALADYTAGIVGDEAPPRAAPVRRMPERRDARDYPTAPVEDDPVTGRSAGEDYHTAADGDAA